MSSLEASASDIRRRTRPWVVAAIILAAFGSLGGIASGVVRYRPLSLGGTALGPGEGVSVRHGDEDGTRFEYREGASIYWSFDLWNAGRWGVTLVDVELSGGEGHSLFKAVGARLFTGSRLAGCCDFTAGEPFRPVAVRAGKWVSILVKADMQDCQWYAENSGNTRNTQRITYRFMGLSRTMEIPIGPITVMSPRECPGREAVQGS